MGSSQKKSIARKAAFITVGIVALLYVGVCTYMYVEQESFLFRPEIVGQDHRWDLILKDEQGLEKSVEEVFLPSTDGARINALHFKLDSAKGVVLYIHGNGGNVGSCSRNRNLFLRNGWEFCVLDYRGYGKSTGEKSQAGLDADVEAGLNYVTKHFPSKQIILYGQSMGSGYATRLAARHTPKLLILEAPYTSLVDVAHGNYPWLPVSWLLKYPSPSLEFIGSVQSEVVIFHGDQDDVIPYEEGVAMAKAANKSKLITLPGQGHAHIQDVPRVQAVLDSLLQ